MAIRDQLLLVSWAWFAKDYTVSSDVIILQQNIRSLHGHFSFFQHKSKFKSKSQTVSSSVCANGHACACVSGGRCMTLACWINSPSSADAISPTGKIWALFISDSCGVRFHSDGTLFSYSLSPSHTHRHTHIWSTAFGGPCSPNAIFFFWRGGAVVLYLIISNFRLFRKDDKMRRVNTMQQIGSFA